MPLAAAQSCWYKIHWQTKSESGNTWIYPHQGLCQAANLRDGMPHPRSCARTKNSAGTRPNVGQKNLFSFTFCKRTASLKVRNICMLLIVSTAEFLGVFLLCFRHPCLGKVPISPATWAWLCFIAHTGSVGSEAHWALCWAAWLFARSLTTQM